MQGWTASTVDAHGVLFPIMGTPGEGGRGQFNLGFYSNPKLDELTDKIASEIDDDRRTVMIHEAMKLHQDDIGHIPLHQQMLNWGVRKGRHGSPVAGQLHALEVHSGRQVIRAATQIGWFQRAWDIDVGHSFCTWPPTIVEGVAALVSVFCAFIAPLRCRIAGPVLTQ